MMMHVDNILYKVGIVQNAGSRFLSRLPVKWWLCEEVISDKTFYNLQMSKQGKVEQNFIQFTTIHCNGCLKKFVSKNHYSGNDTTQCLALEH
jgi:hypothetical protein